jgi:hypothetical protein
MESMPSIGINYLPYYSKQIDHFMPTYWVAFDSGPVSVLKILPHKMIKFLPIEHYPRAVARELPLDNVIWFTIKDMPRPNPCGYRTTMVAAAQIAAWMGAENTLIAGFDCTKGPRILVEATPGVTGTAHFYQDEDEQSYAGGWDRAIAPFHQWMIDQGRGGVWNISDPTQAKLLPRRSYMEWE